MRVAAIDCGTNTVRLLVRDDATTLARTTTITRLGEGLDERGSLRPEAIRRTVQAIADAVEAARGHDAARIAIVATAAARDASNRAAFADAVHAACGIEPRVVDGDTEAGFAYAGAVAGLGAIGATVIDAGAGATAIDAGAGSTVIDVGGGSTEVIEGTGRRVVRAISMRIGSVRIAERFEMTEITAPARLAEIDAALDREIGAALSRELASRDWPAAWPIAVAATATSLAAIDAGVRAYDPEIVHGRRIGVDRLLEMRGRLASIGSIQRLEQTPVLQPGREDVIVAGVSVLAAVLRALGADGFVASEADILDGIAIELLSERGDGA